MEFAATSGENGLFASDYDCIAYLFHKRWPEGFCCPFCDRVQKEIAPAHTVVCRYCRKQCSITANTMMHGSKKSLTEWMQVAAQFCFSEGGVSARSLQQSFGIASYQTAWNWLRKLRRAAAISEAAPLMGPVSITSFSGQFSGSIDKSFSRIACLMETPVNRSHTGRLRLTSLRGEEPEQLSRLSHFIVRTVQRGAVVRVSPSFLNGLFAIAGDYSFRLAMPEEDGRATELMGELQQWMSRLYRGTPHPKYVQEYLDEFTFHHNTAFWTNRLAILDHLLSGILSSDPERLLKNSMGCRRNSVVQGEG